MPHRKNPNAEPFAILLNAALFVQSNIMDMDAMRRISMTNALGHIAARKNPIADPFAILVNAALFVLSNIMDMDAVRRITGVR